MEYATNANQYHNERDRQPEDTITNGRNYESDSFNHTQYVKIAFMTHEPRQLQKCTTYARLQIDQT